MCRKNAKDDIRSSFFETELLSGTKASASISSLSANDQSTYPFRFNDEEITEYDLECKECNVHHLKIVNLYTQRAPEVTHVVFPAKVSKGDWIDVSGRRM